MKKTFNLILLTVLFVFATIFSSSVIIANQINSDPSRLAEVEFLGDYLKQYSAFTLEKKDTEYLKDKVVMVFGGAGSLGTELINKLVNTNIKKLVIVDNHENSLTIIERALKGKIDSSKLVCCIGDIRNKESLESIFSEYEPEIIFHYANYKSVDNGFKAQKEFFNTNVIGTINLLETACNSNNKTEKLIYISSIRAQTPTESYGQTKRVEEFLLRKYANDYPKIKFGSMRCVGVLDSAGSYAIPKFRGQISNKEKITIKLVENGDIPSSYLISRSMAAIWAIKVGDKCDRGEVFSLDGNKVNPIKIDDLVKFIAVKYGIENNNINEWFEKNVICKPGDPGAKNTIMPSSGGIWKKVDDYIIKSSIDADKNILNVLYKTLIKFESLSTNKELGDALKTLFDDKGDLLVQSEHISSAS